MNYSFDCTECNATIIGLKAFKNHQRTHRDETFTHQCAECHQKFKTYSILKTHMESHNSDPTQRRFKCDQEGCQQTFATKANM